MKFVSEGSLPWRFQQCLLKIVSHGDQNAVEFLYEGLEMSNLGDVDTVHCQVSIKESDLGGKCKGLEMSPK